VNDKEGPDNNAVNPLSTFVKPDSLGEKIDVESGPELNT
jgi:hypothetical protein